MKRRDFVTSVLVGGSRIPVSGDQQRSQEKGKDEEHAEERPRGATNSSTTPRSASGTVAHAGLPGEPPGIGHRPTTTNRQICAERFEPAETERSPADPENVRSVGGTVNFIIAAVHLADFGPETNIVRITSRGATSPLVSAPPDSSGRIVDRRRKIASRWCGSTLIKYLAICGVLPLLHVATALHPYASSTCVTPTTTRTVSRCTRVRLQATVISPQSHTTTTHIENCSRHHLISGLQSLSIRSPLLHFARRHCSLSQARSAWDAADRV